MSELTMRTERLELVASNAILAKANLERGEEFGRMLDALIPKDWPPPLNDIESMRWSAEYHAHQDGTTGWMEWFIILADPRQNARQAVGIAGFKGSPTGDGTVEVGYSVMEDQQRKGYATEAVRRLVEWAFANPLVRRVIAETYPELTPSIRVMEKIGMRFIGVGSGERIIRYELKREEWERNPGSDR